MRPLNKLTYEEYNLLKATGMMFEFYPDATGDYHKDVNHVNLFDTVYKCFHENLFPSWESTFSDNLESFTSSEKDEFINLFNSTDKITAKIARDMLEISGHFSDEWDACHISTIVKRLNRLKK